ncbi:MAG: serine hydrolase [Myxococcota bacterium]
MLDSLALVPTSLRSLVSAFASLTALIVLASCGGTEDDARAVQLDPAGLEALREYAMAPDMNTQSVVVMQDGEVVAEWYAPDRGPEDWVTSWSVAKSFAGTMIGIALHEGLLPSLDEPMTTYIPEWLDTESASITLRDVLSMSTGHVWKEWDGPIDDVVALGTRTDQLGYALDQEVGFPPGEVWNYSSGAIMLLSRVLMEATGMDPSEYAQSRLFDPLGFERAEWWEDGGGNTIMYCCIDATSRDFAKLGQLYLQDGVWEGERLLPEDWVSEATRAQQPDNPSYGLAWWLNGEGGRPDRPTVPRSLYWAQGFDGQFIFVFPEQGLVVVRNALFVRPDGPPIAPVGITAAGLGLGGILPTGTVSPGERWDPVTFLELVMEAVVP